MWSTTATCLQQTKELRYMKIGSRSLLKWLSCFTFFPGVFSSTRRWQASMLLVEINTSTISNRLMDQHGFHIEELLYCELCYIGRSIKYYSFGIKHICLSAF